MTFRKSTPRILRDADLQALAGSTRHAAAAARDALTAGTRTAATAGRARIAASGKPARWTAGIATTATIGAIIATTTGGTAAASTPDLAHAGQGPAITATHASGSHASSTGGSGQSGPTTIYDSISPASIPAGQHVATYSDGPYQASNSSVSGRGNVLWIDTNGTSTHADALDVEPGDATPAGAAHWVNAKLTASPHATAIVYTFKSDWTAVQDSIHGLPAWEQSHVKYWIADPTGTPHIVPGASATQWDWSSNYDITMAQPGFFS